MSENNKRNVYLANGAVHVFADALNVLLNRFKRAVVSNDMRVMMLTAASLSQVGNVMDEFFGTVTAASVKSESDADASDDVAIITDKALRADLQAVVTNAPSSEEAPSQGATSVPVVDSADTVPDISRMN